MKRVLSAAALFLTICIMLSGCQRRLGNQIVQSQKDDEPFDVEKAKEEEPKTSEIQKSPEALFIPKDTQEFHHEIIDAKRFIIPDKPDARIAEMRFIEDGNLMIAAWEDGSFKRLDYYIYFPLGKTFKVLPLDMRYIKTLDDGRIFARIMGRNNNANNTFFILNRDNFNVEKEINVPGDVAWGSNEIDISPDGLRMVFYTIKPKENIYLANTDFSNRKLIINAEYNGNDPLVKAVGFVPQNPKFIDNEKVMYTTQHRFQGCQNAIVDIKTNEITRYQWYKDITLYDTGGEDFFFMDNQNWYVGTISKLDDEMNIIKDFRNTRERITSFNYTKNCDYAAISTTVNDEYSYIYIINIKNGEVLQLDPGERLYVNAATWSPTVSEDGKWLAFCDRANGEQQMNGYVLNLK